MAPKFTWSFFSVPNSSSLFFPDSLTMIHPPSLSFLHEYKLTHIHKDIPKVHTHFSTHTPMCVPAYTRNLRCSIYLRNSFLRIPFFLIEDKKHERVKCCHSVITAWAQGTIWPFSLHRKDVNWETWRLIDYRWIWSSGPNHTINFRELWNHYTWQLLLSENNRFGLNSSI